MSTSTIKDRVVYFALAVIIVGGLFFGVNDSISTQNEVLENIRDAARAQVCVLAIPPDDRTPTVVSACLRTYGL